MNFDYGNGEKFIEPRATIILGAGNATKLSQMQNEPKTNPNEPNFSEAKPRSKRNNRDSRQIQEDLFMQNEPNGMLYIN